MRTFAYERCTVTVQNANNDVVEWQFVP